MKKYLSVLSLCLLAACAQNNVDAEKPVVASKANTASIIEPTVEVMEQEPMNDPAPEIEVAPIEPIIEEVAVIEIKVDDNPDQFLGSGLELISERIGAPYFARRDGSIEVWQYQRVWQEGTCHLDLFLYPVASANGDSLKVKYTELRSEFLSRDDQRTCFAEMLRDQIRHHTTPTS